MNIRFAHSLYRGAVVFDTNRFIGACKFTGAVVFIETGQMIGAGCIIGNSAVRFCFGIQHIFQFGKPYS